MQTILWTFVFTDRGWSTVAKVTVVITLIGIAILAVVVGFLLTRVKKERQFKESIRETTRLLLEAGKVELLNPNCTAEEQGMFLPYDSNWEVPRKNINLGNN